MKLVFLGTGTSQGIPVIGCTCSVCRSQDARDKRLRSSVMFIDDSFHLLIDVGPDLRQQMLHNGFNDIDAICITHEHNDHVSGLDDIRPVNFKWNKSIPIYSMPRVINELKRRFHYAFEDGYAARPRLSVHELGANQTIQIGPMTVETVQVNHGSMEILGFIVNGVGYLTDVKKLNKAAMAQIAPCETIIISALHKNSHASHQSLAEALALVNQLKARQVFITHIAHQMGLHKEVSKNLPEHVNFAFDGLELSNL